MSKRVANVKGRSPRHRHFRKHLVMSKYRVALRPRMPVIDTEPRASKPPPQSWLKMKVNTIKNFIRRKT